MHPPALLDVERSAVVVIDLQGKLVDMVYRPDRVIAATKRLMTLAGIFGRPVVLTEQYPQGLGVTHPDVRATFDGLDVPKRHVTKVAFGCCGEPSFGRALDEVLPELPADRRQLVIAGIEAHVCVMQTVIELIRQGSQATSAGSASAVAARSTAGTRSSACARPAPGSRTTSRSALSGRAPRTTGPSAP